MKRIIISLIIILVALSVYSQTDTTKRIHLLEGISISGDWFIAHRNCKVDDENWENKFILKRSYFTIKNEINDVFYVRYTQDLTLDKEGDDAGNVETKIKYLYLKIRPRYSGFITSSYVEIGMVHRPWLTYEQNVNVYRVQGYMAVERNELYNSAGFGVLIGGNIGPKMDKEYLANVCSSMQGKYLSYSIGIYNGGGYASFEQNSNKVIEGIVNFRPFPNIIPQIQLTHAFNIGKGNTVEAPDFNQFLFHGGYIGKQVIITGQYHFGEGDYKGVFIDTLNQNKALKNFGYSIFGEYRIGKTPFAIFARYDYFRIKDISDRNIERQIAGFKYNFYKDLSFILSGERTITETNEYLTIDLNLQISF
jgi:hypothetical protein